MFVFAQSGVVDVVVGVDRLFVSWCVLVLFEHCRCIFADRGMHNVQTMGAAYYANLYLWGTTDLECCGCIHGKVPASGNCWEPSYLQRALRRWPVAGMEQILCPNEENLGLWVLKTFHFLIQKNAPKFGPTFGHAL